jgi:23S rRNA pseudouridine1911/1915/1917 synthase
MKHMQGLQESYKIRFVNRLDMNTSGVLLIGKNSHAQSDFTAQAGQGGIIKKYVALVSGIVAADSGTINLPIGLEAAGEVRRTVHDAGRPSVTHYRVMERFDSISGYGGEIAGGFSFLELELGTGRTHQIRVHLSHIGHPIVGDELYGREYPGFISRQALHASSLRFRHPTTGESMDVEAPIPEDMQIACLTAGGKK